MATVAKVAVQAATYAIDKVYDYLLPPELAGQVGCRVLCPSDGETASARR